MNTILFWIPIIGSAITTICVIVASYFFGKVRAYEEIQKWFENDK